MEKRLVAAKMILALGAALVLVTCGPSGQAHKAVKEGLIGPDSAQFRNELVTAKGDVCGEVNA